MKLGLAYGGLALALSTSAFSPLRAATEYDPLRPFRAEFSVESHGMTVAKTKWRLSQEQNTQVLELHTQPQGLVSLFKKDTVRERSHWRDGGDGRVVPLRYTYQRNGGKRVRDISAEFDWEANTVALSFEGNTSSKSIEAGLLDSVSYIFALMHDTEVGKNEMTYQVLDRGKLKEYRLRRAGTDQLTTDLGELETVLMERVGMRENRTMTFWLAPSLGYFPVKVESRESEGYIVRLKLRDFQNSVEPAHGSVPTSADVNARPNREEPAAQPGPRMTRQ